MDKRPLRAQELRTRTLRDSKGTVLEKPKAPGMHVVVKGPWSYGEVPKEVPEHKQSKLR
jgi:hypothetical protein